MTDLVLNLAAADVKQLVIHKTSVFIECSVFSSFFFFSVNIIHLLRRNVIYLVRILKREEGKKTSWWQQMSWVYHDKQRSLCEMFHFNEFVLKTNQIFKSLFVTKAPLRCRCCPDVSDFVFNLITSLVVWAWWTFGWMLTSNNHQFKPQKWVESEFEWKTSWIKTPETEFVMQTCWFCWVLMILILVDEQIQTQERKTVFRLLHAF